MAAKRTLNHDTIRAMARTHSRAEIAAVVGSKKHAVAMVIWRARILMDNPKHSVEAIAGAKNELMAAIHGCYLPEGGLSGNYLLAVVGRWLDNALCPHNIKQVVNELEYWHSVADSGLKAARVAFLEWCLVNWRPRSKEEALDAFERLAEVRGSGNMNEVVKQLIKG